MSYPINYPTPQGANVQIFTGSASVSNVITRKDWVKPQGASFVWFTLIGAGGAGGSTTSGTTNGGGGGSGAVTNFMCPAFLIPDVLTVLVGSSATPYANSAGTTGAATSVVYQQKSGAGYTLLSANGGNGGGAGGGAQGTPGTGGAAMTANAFTAMGFFQSVAGQDGNVTAASATTFLGGGAGGASGASAYANYGYPNTTINRNGYGFISPIIVSAGGPATGTNIGGRGGFGSGGGGTSSVGGIAGIGGDGLAVIITW